MATLVKIRSLITPLAARKNCLIYNAIRTKAYKHADYMPGPRPETEEEIKKAAEKYGLHPAEYKRQSDEEFFPHGDYPELPMVGTALKDPYYPWDYPDERRNFQEPIHIMQSIMGEDRSDWGEKLDISYRKSQLILYSVLGTMFAIFWWAEDYPMFRPAMKQQFYDPHGVHYTFEPAK